MLEAPHAFSIEQTVRTIRSIVGDATPVPLHEPTFSGQEWDYVKECIDTGWVSSVGKFVDRFEKVLCERCDAAYAVAVVNGTAALHAALLVVGVKPGDEVLVPSLTFAATANSVAHCGAIPHFVDSNWETLGIDADALRAYLEAIIVIDRDVARNRATGRIVRALVPVHVFGHTVNLDALTEIADRFHLALVTDATEALGSRYRGQEIGRTGAVTVLSFNGNKIVTTGGGGAILTNDSTIATRLKHLTTTAKRPHAWHFDHDEVGYNYRLPNLNAALGCAQLEQLDEFVARKRRLAERYLTAFADKPGISAFREPSFCLSNYWLNALVLDSHVARCRDDLLTACHAAGILARPTWRLLHELPHFASSPRMPTPVAEDIQRRVVNVPSSTHLASR